MAPVGTHWALGTRCALGRGAQGGELGGTGPQHRAGFQAAIPGISTSPGAHRLGADPSHGGDRARPWETAPGSPVHPACWDQLTHLLPQGPWDLNRSSCLRTEGTLFPGWTGLGFSPPSSLCLGEQGYRVECMLL